MGGLLIDGSCFGGYTTQTCADLSWPGDLPESASLRQSIAKLSDGKHTHGCCCCGRLQLWLLLLWPITARPVLYETVRSCMASCRLTTSRCTLDVVLLREMSAQPTMLVNKATRWCLGFVDVPRP